MPVLTVVGSRVQSVSFYDSVSLMVQSATSPCDTAGDNLDHLWSQNTNHSLLGDWALPNVSSSASLTIPRMTLIPGETYSFTLLAQKRVSGAANSATIVITVAEIPIPELETVQFQDALTRINCEFSLPTSMPTATNNPTGCSALFDPSTLTLLAHTHAHTLTHARTRRRTSWSTCTWAHCHFGWSLSYTCSGGF